LKSDAHDARHVEGRQSQRRGTRAAARPADDLKTTMSIETTTPGTAQDDLLRREQAKAIFDLLAAARRRSGRKGRNR
jgi:hypothetical protein